MVRKKKGDVSKNQGREKKVSHFPSAIKPSRDTVFISCPITAWAVNLYAGDRTIGIFERFFDDKFLALKNYNNLTTYLVTLLETI